jgi:imidazole glycerol-phosphate synthase subunit HisH
MTVGIIDYGMGNLQSVNHAFDMVGAQTKICTHPEEIDEVQRIVLPGVGAFGKCITNLKERGFEEALEQAVLHKGCPLLGICLGLQVLARQSEEGGIHPGLGWIDADVIRLAPSSPDLRVPQVGWNNITYNPENPLFARLPASPDFYFVHSYFMQCDDQHTVQATCDYDTPITAAICNNNIFATQFHPEKSQDFGLQMIENFLSWTPQ